MPFFVYRDQCCLTVISVVEVAYLIESNELFSENIAKVADLGVLIMKCGGANRHCGFCAETPHAGFVRVGCGEPCRFPRAVPLRPRYHLPGEYVRESRHVSVPVSPHRTRAGVLLGNNVDSKIEIVSF